MYDKPISYSGKSLWDACPMLWHDAYILGNRQPSGPAADRGVYLHELLEDFFKGKTPYPSGNKALKPWQEFMERLATHGPVAEGEVAVTKSWDPCKFSDPKAYFRGKKDLHIEAGKKLILFDWKSGGIYPDHYKQGESYIALSPGYDEYTVNFAYLDQPYIMKRWTYNAEQREAIVAEITAKVEIIRNATEYPATPGPKCAYCHLSWRRGGVCKRGR